MATARLSTFVLLLYLQNCYGQQSLGNNQNVGVNVIGLQQQALQRMSNNMNQVQNGLNMNLAQQANLQSTNMQQSPSTSCAAQGNLQPPLNLPPNMQSQNGMTPQNNFQITKIGFTPVSQANTNPSMAQSSTLPVQNNGVNANHQLTQPQNIPFANTPVTQISNGPVSSSALADLVALKGQSSLLSLINSQNNCQQSQQNQQFVSNGIPAQNQLTDMQKQYLVRSLQAQATGQNQQGINVMQTQPITANLGQGSQQPVQAIVTPLGQQPAYITVQAQPLSSYLQKQSPQVAPPVPAPVEEEPSIMSLILSELGPQYASNPAFTPKKGSKMNLKALIPLIINILKEKNQCGCRNCGCPNNSCQSNGCPNNTMVLDPQMAQIFGGYSNQKMFGQDFEEPQANRFKKNDDEESRNNDKENTNHKSVEVESEEVSEEDDSEYFDDE